MCSMLVPALCCLIFLLLLSCACGLSSDGSRLVDHLLRHGCLRRVRRRSYDPVPRSARPLFDSIVEAAPRVERRPPPPSISSGAPSSPSSSGAASSPSSSAVSCGPLVPRPQATKKILRNGRTITVFTIGTGGMFDQRVVGAADVPKPAQWHRIAVHNEQLGAYAVQKLVNNSAVYIEGDIETRVYNDSINDQVSNIPEICIRRDGKIQLVRSGETAASISLDELSNFAD